METGELNGRGDCCGPGIDGRYNLSYTHGMKTAISIPDALFDEADELARLQGISRSELYQRAVAAYLEREGQRALTEALDRVYDGEPEAGRLDPVWTSIQALSAEDDEWT